MCIKYAYLCICRYEVHRGNKTAYTFGTHVKDYGEDKCHVTGLWEHGKPINNLFLALLFALNIRQPYPSFIKVSSEMNRLYKVA